MASLNKVILCGNLTRDPEMRYTPSGMAVTDLGLAVSEAYKSKTGEMVESVVFVDIVVWGRQAETSAEYLRKGSPVLIEGRLQLDQWQSKEGEKRSKLRVRADRVQFLGAPRRGAATGDAPDQPPPADEPPGPVDDTPPAATSGGGKDDLPF